jgi:hypothetical protein
MKSKLASILLVLIGFVGAGIPARATTRDEITVKLPFEFVVSGETLPAGTYTLSRFSDDKLDGLILSNSEHHISVFVYPVSVGEALADEPQVSFQRVGEQEFLTTIRTSHDVFNMALPRTKVVELAARPHKDSSNVGASGGN